MRSAHPICLFFLAALLAISSKAFAVDAQPNPFELAAAEPVPASTVYSLYTVEVIFDREVAGVDAADLLINNEPATNAVMVAEGQYLFSFSQPPFGEVQVSWVAGHEIKDSNNDPFQPSAWTYNLQANVPTPPIQISEFMASNDRGLRDKDGQTSDWIELYNPTDSEIDLTGWFLTDTAAKLTLWRFPEAVIPAKGYLVVFASEKNLTNPPVQLHTNFKLGDAGEYLALVSPETNVVSSFAPAFPKQIPDISYGRVQSDPNVLGFFVKPTPGALNSTSGSGFSPEVQFSHASSVVTNKFELTLATASPGAVIRYTLTGIAPTNTSPIYSVPLLITNSVPVRARSYQEGLLPGPIRTEAFTFMTNNLRAFTSSLPVLVINTFGKSPNTTSQTYAQLTMFEPEAGWTSLTNQHTFSTRASVKLRGSSTEGLPKSSFAVEIWDELNLDKDISILGLPADADWVLYAPYDFDRVLIHNPFVHQLSRDSGRYSPRTKFVEVFLQKVNGLMVSNSYNGIYVLEEKIKIAKDRVDIDKLQPQHTTLPDISGGYLLKTDRLDPTGDTGISGAGGVIGLVDPKEPELKSAARRPQLQYLTSWFAAFGKALSSTNWRDPNLGYRAYIDVDNWVDFHTLEVLSGNVDSLVLSTYYHKPRNGKLTYGPHWDFDRALGSTDGRDANPRNWTAGPFFAPGQAPWWGKLFTDKDFWQLWVDKWQQRRAAQFSNANINRLIDELANEVREAHPRELKRWSMAPRGGTYQAEVSAMKLWLSNRTDFIDKQLAVPPTMSTGSRKVDAGFQLVITAPANNTIYYTLDGTDPRLPQGNISSNAILYSGPIEIKSNTLVIARSRNTIVRQSGGPPPASSTPWSRPIKTTLYTSSAKLALTEIMFHPADPATGSLNVAEDFQYIELKNNDSRAIDLKGYVFDNGISYSFDTNRVVQSLQPGEHLLLVKNKSAFLLRYPGVNPTVIAGEFSGALAFGGETLSLSGSVGEPVFSFDYSDDWQKLADGVGFSLVLANEAGGPETLGHSSNWRASANIGGSPGATDPVQTLVHPVYVSEVLSNPKVGELDSVELMNPNSFEVNISGWWLSDDLRNHRKFQFPAGTYLPANGFLAVSETLFKNATPAGFGLAASGDEIHLFSADAAGALTGFQHGWSFGATEPGQTYGLFTTASGGQRIIPQSVPTLGRANANPAVGPIVISEIRYEPAGNIQTFEYLEIKNISTQPVPLFDPARPTNAWKISGDVDFDFPPDTVIPGNSAALLLSFAPRNFAAINHFRSHLGLIDQPRMFGPWQGALNNGGGAVRLMKPGTPIVTAVSTDVPMLLVEEINFSPAAPWPWLAAGSGASLTRLNDSAFGDDAANWEARSASPGDIDSDADGLPDSWEISMGLNHQSADGTMGGQGDFDGDGISNFNELRAGTSPANPASRFGLNYNLTATKDIELSFTPVLGRAYNLYYSDTMKPGTWVLMRIYPPATSDTPIVVKEKPKVRYYKLEIP